MPPFRFDVVARADPQALMRLINCFAQLGLLPRRMRSVEADGLVTIYVEQPGLGEQQARIIAEKMRSSVLVETVRVRRGRRHLKSPSGTIDDLSAQ